MTFKLSVWYAATPEDGEPQTFDLTASQAEKYVRPECGFMHDLLYLEGGGVRKLMLEVKP
jgi:hypothetical protein